MAITINVNLDEILAALKNDLDFTGNADKYIKVNATADGFEFAAVTAPTWGAITGTLSSQTDLQNALDAKANLSGAAFTGDVSVTTSGSGDTLQLTNSGSGTTLNILNSGSGDLFKIDTNKLVVSNNGNLAVDTNTLFVDATNNRVGIGTATPSRALTVVGTIQTQEIWAIGSQNNNHYFQGQVQVRGMLYGGPSTQSVSIGNGLNVSRRASNSAAIVNNTNVLTQIDSSTTTDIALQINAAAGQTANLLEVKNSGGTNLFEITASGKVYLGNNTPHPNDATNIVTVNGIMSLSNGFIRIDGQNRVQISTSAWVWNTAITPVAKGFSGYTNQDLTLRTGSTSYNLDLGLASQTNLRIANTTGNVLIGTTTDAGYKLNVNGNGRFLASSTSTIPLTITAAAGQTANLLEVKNSAGTNLFHITASGGIATNGNAGFTGTGSYTNFTIENGIITSAS